MSVSLRRHYGRYGPAREAVGRHTRWFRELLTELAAPASQVHLLIEGANARILAESDLTAIDVARRAAELLMAATCPGRR